MFKTDFGEPFYNLEIVALELHTTSFDKSFSPIDMIEMYGRAIHSAKKHLCGPKYVTKRGYLCNGHIKDLKLKQATLDIDENVLDLIILDEILSKRNDINKKIPIPLISIYYIPSSGGNINKIKLEGSNMYIPEIREAFEPIKVSLP